MESQSKWWNNANCSLESFNICNLFNGSFSKDPSEVCDQCQSRFTLLKRKKLCEKCGLIYCKSCLFNLEQIKVCRKCKIFNLWPINTLLVTSLRVRDLMYYLQTNRISTNTCKEKNDLVELVLVHLSIKHYRNQPNSDSSNITRNTNPSYNNSAREMDQRQNSRFNDEGIRVYSMESTAETDDSSLSGWCLVDNPIIDGTIAGARSLSEEQATNYIPSSDNIKSQNNSEFSNSGESVITEVQDVATNNFESDDNEGGSNEATNIIQIGEEALSIDRHKMAKPANNEVHDIYPGIDAIQELINIPTANLEPPSTNSSSSTPQHHKGSAIEVSSIIKLSSLTDENSIKALSVRQCKEILSLHRVDFSGVTEKHELISKLTLLWSDFKERYADLSSVPEDQICKICMDAPIDCVFLNCGHVISCIFCGKQMAECPICRQNVIRVVRIFKT